LKKSTDLQNTIDFPHQFLLVSPEKRLAPMT